MGETIHELWEEYQEKVKELKESCKHPLEMVKKTERPAFDAPNSKMYTVSECTKCGTILKTE